MEKENTSYINLQYTKMSLELNKGHNAFIILIKKDKKEEICCLCLYRKF